MTIKAVCVHVHVSDNRQTLCDFENSWLPVDVEYRLWRRCVTIKGVCVHVERRDKFPRNFTGSDSDWSEIAKIK